MGMPMALRLQDAGYAVWGYDIRPADQFGTFASRMLQTPAALAERCEVVLSVVRDAKQTHTLCYEKNGLLKSQGKLRTLALCSTLAPQFARELEQNLATHITLLDAPMSGAPIGAQTGELSFMLGGDPSAIEALKPIFSCMGNTLHQLGPVGSGHTAKVLNNFSAAMSVAVTRHLVDAGEKLGVPAEQLLDVMNSSSGQNWFTRHHQQISWSREGYHPENTMGILEKDVSCYAQTVEELTSDEFIALRKALEDTLRSLTPW